MVHRLYVLLGLGLGACIPNYGEDEKGALGEDSGGSGGSGDTGEVDLSEIDEDGDGSTADEDCDDNDASSFPGNTEAEGDDADNDCDGYTDELEVCDGVYDEIQTAIDDASSGGVVQVCPGTYEEFVEIDKDLTLVSTDGAAETEIVAPGAGTAVVTVSSDCSVIGFTVSGGESDSGGGLLCQSSDLTMSDVVLVGNVASTDGGGLAALDCQLDLADVEARENTAGQYGGGMYVSGGRGEIRGSDVVGNTAYEGGGIFMYDSRADLVENEITDNIATTTSEEAWDAGGGGGGLWTNGDGAVHDNVIARNASGYNGGGAFFLRVNADVVGNVVDANTCGEDGAGVYFSISSGTVSGNVISNNAASDDAGGLRMFYGQTDIRDNTFEGNSAGDDGGGAKVSHSEHTFANNTFTGNVAGDAGGGLELDNDSSHVEDCVFEGNRSRRGAGLHNWRTETRFTIEDSVFTRNEASDCGGGMSFDNSPYRINLRRLVFEANSAIDGAGVCVDLVYRDPDDVGGQENYYQDSILDVEAVRFVDNSASDDGGAVYVKAGDVDLRHITVSGGGGYGAVAVKGSPVTLTSSIVADFDGPSIIVEDSDQAGEASMSVAYTDLWSAGDVIGMDDPVGSDGNIDSNPQLDGDQRLGSRSPCIDAGDPSADRDSDGSRADMGAYGGNESW